jgi:hypothetical protein
VKPADIAAFFSSHFGELAGGEYANLRALPLHPHQRTLNKFYRDFEELAEHALALSPEYNVYFGVNPRHLNVGTKEGVTRIVCLHADCDTGEGKVFASKEEAFDALLALPIAPARIVDSGGGLHAYWKIVPVEATRENIARAERAMGNLYRMLGGTDAVHDVSRVLRVPGTKNHKYGIEGAVVHGRA